MQRKLKHIAKVGDKYGKLTILSCPKYCPSQSKVTCLCDCGNKTVTTFGSILRNLTTSCGCVRKASIAHIGRTVNKRHGMSGTNTYSTWAGIKGRCFNPNGTGYASYGGRGITMCDRWLSFENFLADMGEKPSPTHEIDRINPNGDYAPGNCRWAQWEVQQNNRRNNIFLTFDNKTMTIAQWARKLGMNRQTIHHRIKKGWSIEKALTP